MSYRIGYNLFLILSVLFLPWYVYVCFIVAGLYLFDNFFEALVFGVFIDVVFTGPENMSYWFTTVSFMSFVFVQWSKTKISYYD